MALQVWTWAVGPPRSPAQALAVVSPEPAVLLLQPSPTELGQQSMRRYSPQMQTNMSTLSANSQERGLKRRQGRAQGSNTWYGQTNVDQTPADHLQLSSLPRAVASPVHLKLSLSVFQSLPRYSLSPTRFYAWISGLLYLYSCLVA